MGVLGDWMKRRIAVVAAAVVTLALTGCGGGGKGGGTAAGPVLDPEPRMAWGQSIELVPVSSSRAGVVRGEVEDLRAIVNAANHMLFTPVFVRTLDGEPVDELVATCSISDGCTFSTPEGLTGRIQVAADLRNPIPNPILHRQGMWLVGDIDSPEDPWINTGWGRYQAFEALASTYPGDPGGSPVGVPQLGISYGFTNHTNPTETLSWTGAVVGTRIIHEQGFGLDATTVTGDARIDYDRGNQNLDVRFTGLNVPGRESMEWLNLRESTQRAIYSDGETITASFFGPNHEETGGVFNRYGIVGAFGANRQ